MTGTARVTSCGGAGQPESGPRSEFGTALQNAQIDMAGSMGNGQAANGCGPARPMPGNWSPNGWGWGQTPWGSNGFGPPPAMGGCARTGGSSCGCNGNISSSMPTTSGGAPLSSFDFMSGPGTGTMMPPMQSGYTGAVMPNLMQAAMRGAARAPNLTGAYGGVHGGMGAMHGGMGAMYGGMHGMGAMPGGMPGMPMHDGHDYYSLDGIGMVHAKDQLRAGAHLADNMFFERVANGQFGRFSGVSLNQEANGDLEGQVYISGHPAAFHQLYDEGRARGLTGEALNQYIAEELTNVNDIDDIDERYYRIWEGRGYPRPTRDHDLHNTGSVAVTLRPGQDLRLTGAHQYDTRADERYNFTDVQTDARGTFIELYRLSNNNDSGNGHHEDLVLAARIYLDQNEITRLANGEDPLTIANERIRVSDDTDDYRISTGAIAMMRWWGMPIY